MTQSSINVFMSPADFEAVKHDPMLILERGTQFITLLEQQERALNEENKLIQQQLWHEGERTGFTSEQHSALVESASELTIDHQELSHKFVDMEVVNKKLQGIVDALRADKQTLAEELASLKDQQRNLINSYTQLVNDVRAVEEARDSKEALLRTHQEEINLKIAELDRYTNENADKTRRTIELQDATEKLGSGRLVLEAETTALEQATQQQERTLTYLQNEVSFLEETIKTKSNEMVQLKKQMSASILELQLQITKAEEEMCRIRTAVANEKDLTGRQNLWLAKDLQVKTQELLLTRQELTKENGDLKTELAVLREKSARLKSNVLALEKRNQILHEDMKRLETEDEIAKQSYTKRKDDAFDEMNRQAVSVSLLNADLQTAREDMYMLKSKLCKTCRDSLLINVDQQEMVSSQARPLMLNN